MITGFDMFAIVRLRSEVCLHKIVVSNFSLDCVER